jgi:hypothetical protein
VTLTPLFTFAGVGTLLVIVSVSCVMCWVGELELLGPAVGKAVSFGRATERRAGFGFRFTGR